jgi:hypothetical protein
MGNADSKTLPIHMDGWTLLDSKIGYWGDNKFFFYDKEGEENLNVVVDLRRNENYRVTITSSKDNFLVNTSMTGSLDMVQQFLQKRYGKPCPSQKMEEVMIDV